VLDYINYTNLATNYSYGSFPDGQSFGRQAFFHATPGATNDGTSMPPPSFIPYATAGAVYTQNFDSLPNPGVVSVNTANPVTINGITYSLANPFDFAFPAVASGNVGAWGFPPWPGGVAWPIPPPASAPAFGATGRRPDYRRGAELWPAQQFESGDGLLATSTTWLHRFRGKFIIKPPTHSTLSRFSSRVRCGASPTSPRRFSSITSLTRPRRPPSPPITPPFCPPKLSFPTVPAGCRRSRSRWQRALNQTSLGVTNQG